MSGTASLDTAVLVDGLVGVIDQLRGALHPAMGVRPYHVSTVLRTWSGRSVGEGTHTDVVTEISPQPNVLQWSDVGEFRYELEACGLDARGAIAVQEVSLAYKFEELVGPDPIGMNRQWLILVTEAHGQAQPDRYFIFHKPPFPDREKTMGWNLWLLNYGAGR